MNKIFVSALAGIVMLAPFSAFAMTQDEIQSRISVLMQEISLLEQILTLTNQMTGTASTTPDVVTTPSDTGLTLGGAAASSSPISLQMGIGSWDDYGTHCRNGGDHGNFDCSNKNLDGMVKFTIAGPYDSAGLTYYPTAHPEKAETSWGLFHDGEAVAGSFQPDTDYTWKVTVKKGGVATDYTGQFTSGHYSI